MSDIQELIDSTMPVLEAWEVLPKGPDDLKWWGEVAPLFIGLVMKRVLVAGRLDDRDAVLLIDMCAASLSGCDYKRVATETIEAIRIAGSTVDSMHNEEGEMK